MRISDWKGKILLTLGYLFVVIILYQLRVTCLFQSLFGIPCPGCGMTRAMFAACRLDFRQAFEFHSMFWSMPILYGYFLFDKGLFRIKWLDSLVLWTIAAGFLLNWLFRIAELCLFC